MDEDEIMGQALMDGMPPPRYCYHDLYPEVDADSASAGICGEANCPYWDEGKCPYLKKPKKRRLSNVRE